MGSLFKSSFDMAAYFRPKHEPGANMRWDTKKRRYVDSHGHVIPPSDVRKEVIGYVAQEQAKAQKEAEKLLAGSTTLTAFFHFMGQRIEIWHNVAGAISYGGKAQIDQERQARITAKVKSEQEYLAGFKEATERSFKAARQIASQVAEAVMVSPTKSVSPKLKGSLKHKVEKDVTKALLSTSTSDAQAVARQAAKAALEDEGEALTEGILIDEALAGDLIGGTIVNRAGMYADAAYATFQNNVSAREFDSGVTLGRRICVEDDASCEECVAAAQESEGFVPLDELDEIGSLQCLNNCRCEFEFSLEGAQFATSDVFSATIEGQDAYGGSVTIQ